MWTCRGLVVPALVFGLAACGSASEEWWGGSTAPTAPTAPRPTEDTDPFACGLTTPSYGSVGVGSVVTLARHTPWIVYASGPGSTVLTNDDNWAPEMDAFVARRATVTRLSGLDSVGCAGVRVDVDNERWFWRVRDLTRSAAVR